MPSGVTTKFPKGDPLRGEIYWVELDKKRPGLVVSADQGNRSSNAVVVAYITTKLAEKRFPVNVRLPRNEPLEQEGEVRCRNLFSVTKEKLGICLGEVSAEQMGEVEDAMRKALALR
jgi:mRNA-degrading endonuclease toxin of MazEF toxin-antitoxin module